MKLADEEKLKFDIRLARRRGWLEPGEIETELSALPDVSDKIRPPDEEEDEQEPATSALS